MFGNRRHDVCPLDGGRPPQPRAVPVRCLTGISRNCGTSIACAA